MQDHIVQGISPSNTKIDLFDYWLVEQGTADNADPSDFQSKGINKDHYLKFSSSSYGSENGIYGDQKNPSINAWTGKSTEGKGKAGYSDVKGLLQLDENGYYYYDSQKNFAEFNKESNAFTLYDAPGVTANTNYVADDQKGQFFPFDTAGEIFKEQAGYDLSVLGR